MIEVEEIFFFSEVLQEGLIVCFCDQFIEQRRICALFIKIGFLLVDIVLNILLYGAGGRVIAPVIINDKRQGNKPGCNYQQVTVLIDKT